MFAVVRYIMACSYVSLKKRDLRAIIMDNEERTSKEGDTR